MAQPASPRTSAQIIPLPGAAVAPVVNNTRRPGRWPACVVSARQLAVLRARKASGRRAPAPLIHHSGDTTEGAIKLLSVALQFLQEGHV